MPASDVKVGDLAECRAGHIGLVMKIEADQAVGRVWRGIMIDYDNFGKSWQSLNPKRVATYAAWTRDWPARGDGRS
jgi:hypothetical protein